MGNLIQNNSNLTLLERARAMKRRPHLLLDVSYSMNQYVEGNHKRIDALKAVVKDISGPISCIAFNTEAKEISKDDIPAPNGGTWLSPALKLVKEHGAKSAVVVTDGDVNTADQHRTLEEAKGIELQIIYVGSEEKPEFLEKLAKATGGFCSKESLKLPKELGTKIQGLLGPAESERKIEL